MPSETMRTAVDGCQVLIAARFPDWGLAAIRDLGCQVMHEPNPNVALLQGIVRDSRPQILFIRTIEVSRTIFELAPIRLVIRLGAGYDNIDISAATAHGVQVANCPGKSAAAVAELAFGLILALDRRIPDNVESLRQGVWDKRTYSQTRGLKSSALGLIGLGHVGQLMIPRAQAFEMEVIAWSRSLTPAKATMLGITYKSSIEDVAKCSDVLSLHLALRPETRGIIDYRVLQALPDGALLINTARAELIDQAALVAAISSNNLRVGLDVFAEEPEGLAGEFRDPIVGHANVYGTHHIGASTVQAQAAVVEEGLRVLKTFLATGIACNLVNPAANGKPI